MSESVTARLTSDRAIRILRHHGFQRAGDSGPHEKWRHPLTGRQVIVTYHRRVLPLRTISAIIEGSGIEASDWPR